MITVRQLLAEKGNQVWAVSPDSTLLEALKEMESKDVGALLVIESGKLVGIFSERDFARKVSESRQLSLDTPVKDIMTPLVYYVRPEQTLEECMGVMTAKRIRHLPVMSEQGLSGVISIGDVVKEIISDQESMIRGLENYIVGREYIH
ncbi:MAG: CBS domain-containing protein [Chloroflexi bacterium]|nr:CBS domain-containing protein [Chloroflexota bacterium]